VSKDGVYTAGIIPEVEDLFQRQARETDVKKREAHACTRSSRSSTTG
jgi:hypothetical protein